MRQLVGGRRMDFRRGRGMAGIVSRMRIGDVVHQQAARDHARAENDHCGEDDFPIVHGETSAWSTEASRVFSKSCDRSLPLSDVAGINKETVPQTTATATHEAAARQRPCVQNIQRSAPDRAAYALAKLALE